MLDHKVLTDLIALIFDLSAPSLWTSVLYLTSTASKNWQSEFLAFFFHSHRLTRLHWNVVDNPSEVKTISA